MIPNANPKILAYYYNPDLDLAKPIDTTEPVVGFERREFTDRDGEVLEVCYVPVALAGRMAQAVDVLDDVDIADVDTFAGVFGCYEQGRDACVRAIKAKIKERDTDSVAQR